MTLFLTSSLGGHETIDGVKYPVPIYPAISSALKKYLSGPLTGLMIASDPLMHEGNDFYARLDRDSLIQSSFDVRELRVCDSRNAEQLPSLLRGCDFVLLSGGHVPTQMEFFRKIGLKEALADSSAVIIGVSAGSMNTGRLVYAQPELEGEAVDPDFPRWIEGLGFADLLFIPHWQDVRQTTVDGLRVLEDISLPDSRIHPFYAIHDGAYFLVQDDHCTLFGRAERIAGGQETPFCGENEHRDIY